MIAIRENIYEVNSSVSKDDIDLQNITNESVDAYTSKESLFFPWKSRSSSSIYPDIGFIYDKVENNDEPLLIHTHSKFYFNEKNRYITRDHINGGYKKITVGYKTHRQTVFTLSNLDNRVADIDLIYEEKINGIIFNMVVLEKNNKERFASRLIMKEIENSFKLKKNTYINELLICFNDYELSDRAKVVILRTTYRARSRLPAWQASLDKVVESFKIKSIDYKSWLIGLI